MNCAFRFCLQLGLKYFSFEDQPSDTLPKVYRGLHVKYPLFVSEFDKILNLPERFSKNPQISNLMRILLAEEKRLTDRRGDR